MSKPVNISGSQNIPGNLREGVSLSSSPNIRSLRAQFPSTPPVQNIPPRLIQSRDGADSSSTIRPSGSHPNLGSRPPSIDGKAPASGPALEDLTDEDKARVLRRHLVSREERDKSIGRKSSHDSFSENRRPDSKLSSFYNDHPIPDSEAFPIPYHTPGADLTHGIYKWQAEQRRQARPRSASFAGSSGSPLPTFANIHEPGGFRRNYLLMRANEENGGSRRAMPNNFIEFLYLYGHFAGEDLEEIEEEDEESLEDQTAPSTRLDAEAALNAFDNDLPRPMNEDSPLLGKPRSQRRKRANSVSPHGDATVTQAALMLLKAFVGTGILFLGKAFYNGGLLFSIIVLMIIALVSLYAFLLLIRTKDVVPGSFGDIGGKLYGPYMRMSIQTSLTLAQIGFVAAYTIFVAQNLQALVMTISNCVKIIPIHYFLILQLVIFLPLALIRNLARLSTTALVADVFILAGLFYIWGSEVSLIQTNGVAHVEMFNPNDFSLLIGTAVFSFEGVGLVIPISDSMREPRRFPAVLSAVMLFLMVLLAGSGALSYLTFGDKVQPVIMINLDTKRTEVQVVLLLYSLAILLSAPLQLFPAVRIVETGLFSRSGKVDQLVKWQKNIFRFFMVAVCMVVSWVGASDLDKFVAFVGCFAGVPLCYIYPPLLHYKACAKTWKQKAADIALLVFGVIAAVYNTLQTIRLMAAPAESPTPTFGKCGF